MFGSLIAAAIPLVSAIFSVGAGPSLLGVLAAAITFPTTAPTISTLLGLGVAIDYGLFLVPRHREQMDTGMDVITSARRAEGTSGAAVVVAGSTVVIAILGLFISDVFFVGALGLAAAIGSTGGPRSPSGAARSAASRSRGRSSPWWSWECWPSRSSRSRWRSQTFKLSDVRGRPRVVRPVV